MEKDLSGLSRITLYVGVPAEVLSAVVLVIYAGMNTTPLTVGWVKYVLRDGDGTVHARFDSAAGIFTDASAYPTGGDRNVKPPIIPEYEMDGDLHNVEWDVVVVPPETETPMDLRLYEDDKQTPITDLIMGTADNRDERKEDTSHPVEDVQTEAVDQEETTDESGNYGDDLADDITGMFG
ncbi:hypothetical protein [Haladaptatus sp. DFWS20]|uniref:hypothetical protein n=1 Tax=Haladaptatus sp. DFWS20 TaxID=3403467 RepID=UPI003EC11C27